MALQNNPSGTPMSSHEELIVALLTEELKARKFFNALAELGMDNPYHRPCLSDLILQCTGLNDNRNETMDFFCRVMDAHAEKIGVKEETVAEEAKEVYTKLTSFRASLP